MYLIIVYIGFLDGYSECSPKYLNHSCDILLHKNVDWQLRLFCFFMFIYNNSYSRVPCFTSFNVQMKKTMLLTFQMTLVSIGFLDGIASPHSICAILIYLIIICIGFLDGIASPNYLYHSYVSKHRMYWDLRRYCLSKVSVPLLCI